MAIKYPPSAKDTVMSLDNYRSPTILNGADAWVRDIINILFIEKGTYSDTPDLGIDIESLTYIDDDTLVSYVNNELHKQTKLYLSNIPISKITVGTYSTNNGDNLLLIDIAFDYTQSPVHKSALVSLRNKTLDFIVDNFSTKVD